jgi:BlaI family transcriptional regulator, penicillinase repressor
MTRPSSPTPTDWELNLLQVLWESKRCSVDDVRESLRRQGHKRSDSAVRKILNILVEKSLACSEMEGRTTYFSAAIRQERLEKSMFAHLVQTLFGGNEETFLLRAMDESNVTPEVVKRMKEIVSEHDDKPE